YGHGACVEQDDKGWDARKRAYCLKIQPATGSFARNLIYSTKPLWLSLAPANLQRIILGRFLSEALLSNV
ncbi:hypothetical protein K7A35_19400, partial [Escherichia marmotae]|nr:hypothetical protein [Escherichia marmotae]